jgi:hypothetical protein
MLGSLATIDDDGCIHSQVIPVIQLYTDSI